MRSGERFRFLIDFGEAIKKCLELRWEKPLEEELRNRLERINDALESLAEERHGVL